MIYQENILGYREILCTKVVVYVFLKATALPLELLMDQYKLTQNCTIDS